MKTLQLSTYQLTHTTITLRTAFHTQLFWLAIENGWQCYREITSTGYLPFNNVQVRIINACSPEDSEDAPKETEDRAMAWKRLRRSITLAIWCSLYFGFLISIFSATIVGTVFILVYYLNYQTILNCLSRPKESIPIKIQWSQTISEIIALVFSHV